MVGLFHSSLEEAAQREYTLRDILRKPLHKNWREAFAEIFSDLNYEETLPGSKKTKSWLNDISAFVSFGITSGLTSLPMQK